MGQYRTRKRKLGLVCQCIALSLILVFGQGVSGAITGNQDSCEGITYNLSTNSQDQGVAFPLLPYSGGNQIPYNPEYLISDQYYIKYTGFGCSCIDKHTGLELPASLFPTKIIDTDRESLKIIQNCGILVEFSRIIQFDEKRFCATKQENFKEYLLMFDQDGIKWKTHFDDASSYPLFAPLSPNRILYGPNIVDLETGKVLLELDRKYKPLEQRDVIKKGGIAVINKSIVIDVEKPAVLWTLPEDPKYHFNVMGFYEDKLIYFNTSNNLVSYYDPSSGELLKTFEFKPRLEPGERIGRIDGLAGKSIYSEVGYVIDIESGILLTQKNHDLLKDKWGHFAGIDEKWLFWEDIAGIECLDPKTGKTLWRREISPYVFYQELEGKIYKNTFHLADKDNNIKSSFIESLSILEDGSWRELAKAPLRSYLRPFISKNGLSLIPTKYGILWLPQIQHDSAGPSIIAPGTSQIQRTYLIPDWDRHSWQNTPGYALTGDTLIVNLDGYGIHLVDLASGKTEQIKIPDASNSDKHGFYKSVPIFADKKYAITYDEHMRIVCFDITKKVFLRRMESTDKKIHLSLDYGYNHSIVGEWFSIGNYITNLETGEIIDLGSNVICATNNGFFIIKDDLSLVVPEDEPRKIIDKSELFYKLFGGMGIFWKTTVNYAICNTGVIDFATNNIVQKFFKNTMENRVPFIFQDELLLTASSNTVKLSPCPSFSVKRNGKTTSGDNEVSFEFRNTREDGRDLVLKGEVYLVSWGDDGKAPVFAKLNEPRHKLGPLLPGMSQEITFKLPEPPLLEHNQKGEGKYFALVVESNGLMDREKSVLSEYDKDPRPLFDGTPVALDQQKAIAVTVWGR